MAPGRDNPMNIHNKPTIYTINNAAPPSYAEATGASASASAPHNPQFDQRYPHVVVSPLPSASFPHPYPPNCYQDTAPVQSTYPQYESTESQPTAIIYNRPLITGNREYKSCNFARFAIIGLIFGVVIAVFVTIIKNIR